MSIQWASRHHSMSTTHSAYLLNKHRITYNPKIKYLKPLLMSIVDPYLLHQQKNGTESGCNRFRDNTPCYLYSVHTRSGVSMLRAWLRAVTPHPGEEKPVIYIPWESAVIISKVTAELDRSWCWCCYCSKSSWHSTTAWWLSAGGLCTGGWRGARWWFRTNTRLIVYSQVSFRITCNNQSEIE